MSREQNLEIAKGLREAAEWIEANADLPFRVAAAVTDHVSQPARAVSP